MNDLFNPALLVNSTNINAIKTTDVATINDNSNADAEVDAEADMQLFSLNYEVNELTNRTEVTAYIHILRHDRLMTDQFERFVNVDGAKMVSHRTNDADDLQPHL